MMAATIMQAQTERSDAFKAKYFSAGFLPFANVEIQHKYDEDKMDPVFKAQFTMMPSRMHRQPCLLLPATSPSVKVVPIH